MRCFWAVLALTLCWSASAHGQRTAFGPGIGSIELPAGYSHQALPGYVDAARGLLVRTDSGLSIRYSIGVGNEGSICIKADGCSWEIQHRVGNHAAHSALIEDGERRWIVTSIHFSSYGGEHATFTAEVRNDRDLAEFLLIATSFKFGADP